MLTIPAEESADFAKVGTISAVRRLLEYGWDKETPPLMNARRVLFRLLAEDDDQSFLFELGGASRLDTDMARRGRGILREAAAATLAQAGYESDPRLRGAARRILDRLDNYLRSQLAQKPWVRVGNRQVLAAEAAPPTIYGLQMLAFMPLFRHENHTQIDRLYAYLSQTLPRQEAVQAVGRHLVEQPQVVLGDPLGSRNVVDADVPFALHWLELMARFGFLRRNESWSRLFDRFLDDRDRELVWHPHKGTLAPRSVSSAIWHTFPLDAPAPGGNRRPDVTFRLGLIARLSGRPIELV